MASTAGLMLVPILPIASFASRRSRHRVESLAAELGVDPDAVEVEEPRPRSFTIDSESEHQVRLAAEREWALADDAARDEALVLAEKAEAVTTQRAKSHAVRKRAEAAKREGARLHAQRARHLHQGLPTCRSDEL